MSPGDDRPVLRRADAPVRLVVGGLTALILVAALNLAQVKAPETLTLDVDSLGPAALLLAFAAVTTLAFVRMPSLALGFLVVMVAANLSEILVRYHDLPSLLQLFAIPLGLAAIAECLRRGARGLRSPLIPFAVAYVLVVLASTTWAESTALADAALVEHLRGATILAVIAVLAADRRRLDLAGSALVGTAAILALLGIVQGASGQELGELFGLGRIKYAQIYGDVFESRIAGPFGDPNYFAQNLLLILPLAGALALTATTTARRATWAVAGLLVCGGIFFTYSRGAAVALAVQALLVIPLLRASYRRVAIAAVAVGMAALLLLPTGFTARLATIAELLPGQETIVDPDSSFEKRRVVTGVAWRMFLDHPGVGVGAGNYTVHFDRYAAEIDSAGREYLDPEGDQRQYPHNLYLEVAAETGFLGLLAFLALVTTAVLALRDQTLRSRRNRDLRPWALALGIGVAGYLVAAIFLHGQFQRPFWLVLGLVAAVHTIAHRREEGAS